MIMLAVLVAQAGDQAESDRLNDLIVPILTPKDWMPLLLRSFAEQSDVSMPGATNGAGCPTCGISKAKGME